MGIFFSTRSNDNTALYDRKKILTIAGGLGYSRVDVKRLRTAFTKAGITREQELYVSDFISAYDFENVTFVQLVLSIFDLESTGFVSFEEFLIALWNALTLDHDMLFAFVYDCFDKNHVGKLSGNEVKRMISIATGNDYTSMILISSFIEEKQDSDGNISFIILRDYLSHTVKANREILSPMIEQQRVMRAKLLGSKRWMTLSVQRQVVFRSQNLYAILGLLAYNRPLSNRGTGTGTSTGTGTGTGTDTGDQKQLTTKKPEPHVSQAGLKNGQIHLDDAMVGGGGGAGVEDASVVTGGSDSGSLTNRSQFNESEALQIAKAALAALNHQMSAPDADADTTTAEQSTSSRGTGVDVFPGPNVPIQFPYKHQRMVSIHMDKSMLAHDKRKLRAKARSFDSYAAAMHEEHPTQGRPTGAFPLDRAMSMRPTATNTKGIGALSQLAQSNLTAPVFNEVYELPGAMFDSTDILVSTTASGANTPANRRSTTNVANRGSFIYALGAGGSDYRTAPPGQGLDLKASILSNLQHEKANKRKAKRQGRSTFG